MSSKRSPPDGQDFYLCRWRLRDKKGVLDPNGHTFCNSQLMTADLLARHVLSQHVEAAEQPATDVSWRKIACKWDSCFNRHYDPSGLAAHLVYDHFTQQMGLKYACVAQRCTVKTVLTSLEALERHHAQYHSGSTHSDQIRPVWKPVRSLKDSKGASNLLAAIRKLDTRGPTIPKIPVSDHANPNFAPITQKARTLNAIEFKRKYFDPLLVQPGPGQDGEPWNHLYRRVQKNMDHDASVRAAHDAIFCATDYDQQDLDRLCSDGLGYVELTDDTTIEAIQLGLERAQLYDRHTPSAHRQDKLPPIKHLRLRSEGECEVAVLECQAEQLVETIGPKSLASIEREMDFDASLSKQRRWVDTVLKLGPVTTNSHRGSAADVDPGLEVASQDWAPPLRLDPYHPSSRCRFAIDEDNDSDEKPRAIRRNTRFKQEEQSLTSPTASSSSSSRNSPRARCLSSSLTPPPDSTPLQPFFDSARVKRELDHNDGSLLNGSEPPRSRIKLEEGETNILIDLTGDSEGEGVGESLAPTIQPRSVTPYSVFVELEPNALIETSPGLHRFGGKEKDGCRLTSISHLPQTDIPR